MSCWWRVHPSWTSRSRTWQGTILPLFGGQDCIRRHRTKRRDIHRESGPARPAAPAATLSGSYFAHAHGVICAIGLWLPFHAHLLAVCDGGGARSRSIAWSLAFCLSRLPLPSLGGSW